MSIRRGKQILAYEYMVEVEWFGETDADECSGWFKVVDINESDTDFDVNFGHNLSRLSMSNLRIRETSEPRLGEFSKGASRTNLSLYSSL